MKLEKPIIIVEKILAARQKLLEALKEIDFDSGENVKKVKDPLQALKTIKSLISMEAGVDLVVSDIFFNEDFNAFGLIREMEKVPELWNTPLVVYTNQTDEETYNRIRQDIIHLPFRIIPKKSTAEDIKDALSQLLEFRTRNRYYLDLETKLMSFIQNKNFALLSTALQMINKCNQKYPTHCTPAKMNFLKGKLYFEFWKSRSNELEPLMDKMQKCFSGDKSFSRLEKEMRNLTTEINDLKNNAERYFLASHHLDPKSWKSLHAFYNFHMEARNFREAKKYLTKLVEILPDQSKYFFKMGKIHEFEGDFSQAIQCYMDAFNKISEEGAANFDVNDMMEIVDASLAVSRELMTQAGVACLDPKKCEPGSEIHAMMLSLRKNNAQVRSILISIAGKDPRNADHLNKIGMTYRRAGDYSNAINMYSKALTLDPDNARIRVNNSVVLALCGSWDEAIKEAGKALQSNDNPQDARTINNLIDILSQKDQTRLQSILS